MIFELPFGNTSFTALSFLDSFDTKTQSIVADRWDYKDYTIIHAEVPGFKKEEVTIGIDNGYLAVTAERKSSSGEDEKCVFHLETMGDSRRRRFYVGNHITDEDVSASLSDGILSVRVQKHKPKSIPIQIE